MQQAEKAAEWLNRSLEKSKGIKFSANIKEADFDVLENLTSRFARLCDILFSQNLVRFDAEQIINLMLILRNEFSS